MPFDFTNLQPEKKAKKAIDPIELFQGLRVTDASINDLWLAQGDALRGWHNKRTERDLAVSLNTGAGKTLVGLLMAQSLVNETRGLILYACSSIQLVRQTEQKALGYGLPITTYISGEFSNDLSNRGEATCITTYQALFNGKSRFTKQEIAGIIFDDAHAAEHLLRDHFSLHLRRDTFPELYDTMAAEFRGYFHDAGKASTFEEIVEDRSARLLLVHPAETRRAHQTILAALRDSKVAEDTSTLFAWTHLKDRIDLCAFLVSGEHITISPAFVPVRTLPYFSNKDTRRIYLSATFTGEDAFIRTFGRRADATIAPTTTAGECERMILVPGMMTGVTDDLTVAKQAIAPYKALVLTPSGGRARLWADTVAATRENVSEAIEDFKSAGAPEKLLLTARYDGVDLPGDMCRVVSIDDLPSGTGPVERFLWEYLGLSSTLRTAVASRVVQSFGRISRGMSDHGVALLTGKRLVSWLCVPRNLEILPRFLQKQLQLGFKMSDQLRPDEVPGMVQKCLGRDREWVQAYENFMGQAEVDEPIDPPAILSDLAMAETKFAEALWKRDFTAAAKTLQATFEESSRFSASAHGWHKLWAGFALECAGDQATAAALYRQAHATLINIPRPQQDGSAAATVPEQVITAALNFDHTPDGSVRVPRTLDRDLAPLKGGATPAQTEEALRKLGQYLGLPSSRPDQEHGTGPDVLWLAPGKIGFCVDAKTDKLSTSQYTKEELGQLSDHVQWVLQNHECDEVIPVLVGPEVACSKSANPPEAARVADLKHFAQIADVLAAVYRDTAAAALPITLASTLAEQFTKRGLIWTALVPQLGLKPLKRVAGR